MNARRKMDRLISLVNDFGAIESEMRQYEEMVHSKSLNMSNQDYNTYIIIEMIAAMDESRELFDEQVDIISEAAPPVAEQMDNILAAYDDTRSKMEDEFEKMMTAPGEEDMPPELDERINEYVYDLGRHYDELRKTTVLVYNCLASAINFIGSDVKKYGRKRRGGPATARWGR